MSKILIIEDEPGFQEMLALAFQNAKFETILASDGKQGLIKAVKERPDFILIDLMMPVMSGTTFLQHVGELSELSHIPIAVLTVVPEEVPQRFHGAEAFKRIVGFWIKDQLTTKEIVERVNGCLNNQADASQKGNRANE